MKAVFAFTGKYEYCEGIYYSNGLPAATWKERYLNIFDKLIIVGRIVEATPDMVKGKSISSTEGVEFHCTPLGINTTEFFTRRKEIEDYIENEVKNCDFVIARLALFGAIAVKYAKKYNIPYVCEVVGSAWDDNWNYSIKGKLVAPYFEMLVKKTVWESQYTIYVTQQFLQKEYPTKGKSIGISNVEIKEFDETIIKKRIERIHKTDINKLSFCTLAAVDVKYKGQEFMIKAMSRLKKKGIRIRYIMVGGGDKRYLSEIAQKYGVFEDCVFTGSVEHAKVFDILDSVDIYIQPSLQEGLPRALVEAMSRGLPAMGFNTAGIPELISNEFVLRRKSVDDICNCIEQLNIKKLEKMSSDNYNKAKEFDFCLLNKLRQEFITDAMKRNQNLRF